MLAKGHVNLHIEYVTLVQCYLQDWESIKNVCNMYFNSVNTSYAFNTLHKEVVGGCKLSNFLFWCNVAHERHVHAV